MSVPNVPIPPQDVIASRELSILGDSETVLVELGRPHMVTPSEAVCTFRFTYRGNSEGWQAHGSDTFQALELALKIIPTELRHRPMLPLGRMYLYEPGDDMGFPEVYT
ncbi:MAG TPA: hypothetical protein VJ476_01495 [Rhizomicrobium sp.]|nr:hypothetical protein [Rhizomicrobium sp.]